MKVFISWSGDKGKEVAKALQAWLPQVIQAVDPFMSEQDIKGGEQWANRLGEELRKCEFGIVCVTRESREKPWLLYEAGALATSLQSESNVMPFLVDLKYSELEYPLAQFQAASYVGTDKQEELRRLVKAVNSAQSEEARLNDGTLDASFEKWSPDLIRELDRICSSAGEESHSSKEDATAPSSEEVLEQVLATTRGIQTMLGGQFGSLPVKVDSVREGLEECLREVRSSASTRHHHHHLTTRQRRGLVKALRDNVLPQVSDAKVRFLILISTIREPFPWLYWYGHEIASGVVHASQHERQDMADSFMSLVNLCCDATNAPASAPFAPREEAFLLFDMRDAIEAILDQLVFEGAVHV